MDRVKEVSMFLLVKPPEDSIRRLLFAQCDMPFSYREVGASRTGAPPGYTVDHNRVRLGEGSGIFRRAVAAVQSWMMFDVSWIELCWPDAPICIGSTVSVVARHFGFWSLNVCRIVYVIEEGGNVERYGFAYGTLPEHGEIGEERFMVEWDHQDDSVWYDLYAFSRPQHLLAKIGYPISRGLQKRFARESKQAMVKAISESHT